MRLQYEIAVDDSQMKRVMRGVESELKASNRRVASEGRRASTGGGSVLTGGADGRQADAHVRARTAHIVRENQRAERAAEQAVRNRSKLEEQAHRRKVAMQNRYFAEEQRKREALERTAQRHQAQANRIRERSVSSFAGGAARSARGAVGGALAIGGTALGVAGGFAAAGAILEQSQIRTRAAKLANQAGDPGLKGQLAQEAQGVRGFSGAESLSALEAFVTPTGDLGTARAILQDMGTLALATGTDFSELGAAAGQAFNVIKDEIKDPQAQVAALKDVMSTLAQQGAMGAVEIRQLATDLGRLGASTRKFEGGSAQLLKTFGTFAQVAVARGGASSSAEASTAAMRLGSDIVKNEKDFKNFGIDIYSDKTGTKLRDPLAIMQDILAKTGGRLDKTGTLFNEESAKIFAGFSPLWIEAEKQNAARPKGDQLKKGEAGKAAVQAEYNRFANANVSAAVLRDRAESLLVEPEMQFKEATKAFNEAVGTQLLPVLTSLIPKFAELIPVAAAAARVLAKLVSAFAENPVAGIGLLIGAAIVKDIVGAKIGDMIKRALTGVGSTGGSGAVPGIGGDVDVDSSGKPRKRFSVASGTDALGAAGVGATIGLTVATAIISAGVANFEMGEESMKQTGQNVLAAARSTDPNEIRALRDAEQQKLDKNKRLGFWSGAVAGIFGQGAGETVAGWTDPTRQEQINTSKNAIAGMDARAETLDKYNVAAEAIIKSAKTQEEAAAKLKEVADKLGLVDMKGREATQSIVTPGRT